MAINAPLVSFVVQCYNTELFVADCIESIFSQDGSPDSDRQHDGKPFKGCELIDLLQWNFICAPTIIARRECFLRHLPVPSNLSFHDWYFTVKIAQEVEFYFVPSVLADYRVHEGNMH